MKTTTEK